MLREVGLVDADKGTLEDLVTGNSDVLSQASAVRPKPVVAEPRKLTPKTVTEERPAE